MFVLGNVNRTAQQCIAVTLRVQQHLIGDEESARSDGERERALIFRSDTGGDEGAIAFQVALGNFRGKEIEERLSDHRIRCRAKHTGGPLIGEEVAPVDIHQHHPGGEFRQHLMALLLGIRTLLFGPFAGDEGSHEIRQILGHWHQVSSKRHALGMGEGDDADHTPLNVHRHTHETLHTQAAERHIGILGSFQRTDLDQRLAAARHHPRERRCDGDSKTAEVGEQRNAGRRHILHHLPGFIVELNRSNGKTGAGTDFLHHLVQHSAKRLLAQHQRRDLMQRGDLAQPGLQSALGLSQACAQVVVRLAQLFIA